MVFGPLRGTAEESRDSAAGIPGPADGNRKYHELVEGVGRNGFPS